MAGSGVKAVAQPAPQRRLVAIAAGYALAGAFVLWLGFWVAGRESRPAVPSAHALVIYDPAPGAVVERPVTLLFETRAPLSLEPAGWVAGRLHLHASVDGVEIMPGPNDIRPLGAGRFRWQLPATVAAGTRQIQLYWAGPDHRPLVDGASAPVRIEVR